MCQQVVLTVASAEQPLAGQAILHAICCFLHSTNHAFLCRCDPSRLPTRLYCLNLYSLQSMSTNAIYPSSWC
jgi:hypothetical protein